MVFGELSVPSPSLLLVVPYNSLSLRLSSHYAVLISFTIKTPIMMEVDKSFAKRVKKTRRGAQHNGSPSVLPSGLVCQPTAAQPDAMEIGVVLSLLILAVYCLGFYETWTALPDTPAEPQWRQHMGQNLNLAVPTEWSHRLGTKANDGDSPVSLRGAKGGTGTNRMRGDIPVGVWPVSIRNEPEDEYETMLHPGNLETVMKLPKFWSKPIHHNQLMTRDRAMQIGTCAEPDPRTGSAVRGDDCPTEARTIFVAIASYRDFECRLTVESAFKRAAHPERLRIGVVDQIVSGEDVLCNEPVLPCEKDPTQALCRYKDQVDVYQMEAELSIGPVFARHIGHRLYRGEYYSTQSDAHVTFTQNWDMDIISQMEATANESEFGKMGCRQLDTLLFLLFVTGGRNLYDPNEKKTLPFSLHYIFVIVACF